MSFNSSPVVKLDVGFIQGINVIVDGTIPIDIFYGVPFAEPPIGENRFEKPRPLKPWKGIKPTIKQAPFCPPIPKPSNMSLYSEDCLYLNVFKPSKASNSLPIMFMVHGGGFEKGNSARYANVNEIGRKFTSKGIIIVAIQYRLGQFGFASSGEAELLGNLGYFDQCEALKFVHRNAEAFGGDSQRITIYGSSAGGASVLALSISPYSRDYVHQVISASGSVFAAWTTSDNVIENTKQLTSKIGIQADESIKDCLKRASLDDIYNALEQIETKISDHNFVRFGPRLDGDFLPKDYPKLIEETKPKPILIGCSQEESLLWTLVDGSDSATPGFTVEIEKRDTFCRQDVEDLVYKLTSIPEAQSKIIDFYLNNADSTKQDNVLYLRKYTQIFSDLQFNVPIALDILLRSNRGWPVYVYKSAYVNPGGSPLNCPIKDAFHGSDQRYFILGRDQGHYFEMNQDDKEMESLMVEAFTSFVKTGSPSTSTFEWLPTFQDSTLYAELKPHKPEMKTDFFADQMRFWNNLTCEFNYDFVRIRPRE